MDNKNITGALLERYHRGECTDEEIEQVERWLLDTNERADETLDTVQEAHIERVMWEAITGSNEPQRRHRLVSSRWAYRWRAGVAAAAVACIGLCLVRPLTWKQPKLSFEINNKVGNEPLFGEVDSLRIATLPRSHASIDYHPKTSSAAIAICRSIVVKNEGLRPVTVDLSGSCRGSNFTQQLVCVHGETYVIDYRPGRPPRIQRNTRGAALPFEAVAAMILQHDQIPTQRSGNPGSAI